MILASAWVERREKQREDDAPQCFASAKKQRSPIPFYMNEKKNRSKIQ
jgi:hypothetical protein